MKPKQTRRDSRPDDVVVKTSAFGITAERAAALALSVTKHRAVVKFLGRSRNRLLSFEILDADFERKPARPTPPRRFRATFFDYTRNRTVYATGNIKRPSAVTVTESNLQPLPSQEEFDEAVSLLMKERELAGLLKSGRMKPYPPMPPLIAEELADGTIERTIAVGLLPSRGQRGHEIVGVNMIRKKVLRFDKSERGRAPSMSAAHNPICGLPYAGQQTLSNTPGQAWVTVTQGGTVLWKFLVVRPAGSSGTNGSGVELRFVDYRGKRVLYRAHVPILNVQYDGNACGPYRDWQNQEGMLQAVGSDPVPGFRLCTAPATTILDTGKQAGIVI